MNSMRRAVTRFGGSAPYALALAAPVLSNFTLIPLVEAGFGQDAAKELLQAIVLGGVGGTVVSLGLAGPITRDLAAGELGPRTVSALTARLGGFGMAVGAVGGIAVAIAPGAAAGAVCIAAGIATMLWGQAISRAQHRPASFCLTGMTAVFGLPAEVLLAMQASGLETRLLAAFAIPVTVLGIIAPGAVPGAVRRLIAGRARVEGGAHGAVPWRRLLRDGIPTVPHGFALLGIGQCFRFVLTTLDMSAGVSRWNAVATLALAPGTVISLLNQAQLADFFERPDGDRRREFTHLASQQYLLVSAVSGLLLTGAVFAGAFGPRDRTAMLCAAALLVASTVPQGMYMTRINYVFADRATSGLALISPVAFAVAAAIAYAGWVRGDVVVAASGPFAGYAVEQLLVRWLCRSSEGSVAPIVRLAHKVVQVTVLALLAWAVVWLPRAG